jgi:hypothetical protein
LRLPLSSDPKTPVDKGSVLIIVASTTPPCSSVLAIGTIAGPPHRNGVSQVQGNFHKLARGTSRHGYFQLFPFDVTHAAFPKSIRWLKIMNENSIAHFVGLPLS